MKITTDFGSYVKHKEQILQNALHYRDLSEVLAMLQYGEGTTNKSFAYLFDDQTLVGYCYIEHWYDQNKRPFKGTFGIYIDPYYRKLGASYQLVEALRTVLETNGLLGILIEVDPKALKIFQKVFGENYPIQPL